MVGHYHKTITIISIAFQNVEPIIDDIVTVYFLNQGQPFVTSESDEETSIAVWYRLLNWQA